MSLFLQYFDALILSFNFCIRSTQIIFNRAMAHLAVAAFVNNNIHEAHNLLSDIVTGKTRELLAQGVSFRSGGDRNIEQERAEKRRQVVSHQQISLDLLDAVYFTCAMLLEVPNMNANDKHGKTKKIISRHFRKYNDIFTRVLLLHNPPETVRDHIMLAASYLQKGDWKECGQTLIDMEIWSLLPNSKETCDAVEAMLLKNVKVEALRTYLLAHSKNYDSLALSQLQLLFEMEGKDVHCIVSKMILSYELSASWDSVAQCIAFHKVDPSALQNLSVIYAEKLNYLVEANERLMDARFGRGNQDSRSNWHGHQDRRGHDNRRGSDNRRGDNRRGGGSDGRRGGGSDGRRGGGSDGRKSGGYDRRGGGSDGRRGGYGRGNSGNRNYNRR